MYVAFATATMIDRISAMENPKSTACYVLYREGKCLMESRPDLHKSGQSPYWVYPGGKIEDGERPTSAAIRECMEELNVTPYRSTALPPVSGPNGWTISPIVFVSWEGEIPLFTLDRQRAPLTWLSPHAVAGEPDGSTCVRQVANEIIEAIEDIEKQALLAIRMGRRL